MIGRTIGNYVVRSKIGEGGMGAVYLAEHPRIGRKVAIKVLHAELSHSPEAVGRFFVEARAANEIRSEHIIDILDFGELSDGTSYFIMEWLEGRSLAQALQGEQRFELPRALHVVRGVAQALAAAHERGIVHRDLKPDNIFLCRRTDDPDFVKVLDFGIAKLTQKDPEQSYKTQTGALLGTPYYMSPEQARGRTKQIDRRTDVYSLGVIVYQMVTGRLPFDADGLGELLLAHMTRPPRPPVELVPTLPAEVNAAILRALEKEPDARFGEVAEMAAALGAPLPLPVGQAGRSSAAEAGTLPAGRLGTTTLGGAAAEALPPGARRRLPAVVVGIVVLGVALGLGLTLRSPRAPHPTSSAVPDAEAPLAAPAPRSRDAGPAEPGSPGTAHVVVRAEPASARIQLDGAELGNPAEGRFPSGVRHLLTVTAHGYRTDQRWVVFDQDRELVVRLVRGGSSARAATQPRAGAADNPRKGGPAAPGAPTDDRPVYRGTKGKILEKPDF